MHLVGVGSNGDLPLAQLPSTIGGGESLVQLSMIPEQYTDDRHPEFDSLPCDLQIAIVCYYFVRYSTLEEVVKSGLLSPPGTDEQLENLKLDFMKRRCDEYKNHTYVSISKTKSYYHPSVIKRFGMETTRLNTEKEESIITLEILYSIFKSRIDHVRRLVRETLAPKDMFAFDPKSYITQGGEEGVEYKLYHFLPGMSLIANELGFTETFVEQEDGVPLTQNDITVGGKVRTLEKTGLFRVMLSEQQYDMKKYSWSVRTRGRVDPISFVDSINDMRNGLMSTLGSIDESTRNVLGQWNDLIEQYIGFGEVDYQKYNAIAQWHMENGLYQSARSSGVNPMWKYFYGIRPIESTFCLLDTQRFGFQLISRVRRILGEFAIGDTYDSMSLERATTQLKRTAATALAVEQDLHQTWHQKLDVYNDGISKPPDWYREAHNSLVWLYYKRNENGTIYVDDKGDDDGGLSIFSGGFYNFITNRLPPDTAPSMDVLYVPVTHFKISDLNELSNFNYNETGTIGFIDDPDFTEALKRVEEANSGLDNMVTERSWNKDYNTPNRNPIGLTTYASYDSIMGCRTTGLDVVLKCAEFSDDYKTVDQTTVENRKKIAIYEFAERSWDELKREMTSHPKYGIPSKVETLRAKYEVKRINEEEEEKSEVVVKSGCFEGDSIPCIFLDLLRESENLCAYNAIKAYKRMIKIQRRQLSFLLCDVYPVLNAMWDMVKLKIDRCKKGSDLDALLNDFNNSRELKSFLDKERDWKQHSYEAWDFSTMTEKTQHRQGYIDDDEGLETRLGRVTGRNGPIDVCSELNWIHGALKTKIKAVLEEIDGIATTLYSSYRLAPVDSTWYNLLSIAAKKYGIEQSLTLVSKFTPIGVFTHMKHIPETRARFADVYHHFCKGNEYKLGPVFQLVFRLKETPGRPQELISIEEVHNQDKAYTKTLNSVNCVHAIAAFLRKRYAQHTAAGQLFEDKSKRITELEEKGHTTPKNIKEMHQILDDYYKQQAGGSEDENKRVKAAGLEERRNGYIPRRSMPSTKDEKFYPCFETLNSSMKTMSYIDNRPIDAEIRDHYEIVADLKTKLEKLRDITTNDVTIDLSEALVAFEAVETAVEALFVSTSLRFSEFNTSEGKKDSKKERTIDMVEYRKALGPQATDTLKGAIKADKNKVLHFTKEERDTLGIANSRDRFTEFQPNKIFDGSFFCIVNPFDEDENPLRNKMRHDDGRTAFKLKDPEASNWLRQYEMMLLYTAQVLGNVFRYGGYRARKDSKAPMFRLWRYPNYSSDIEKVNDSPTDTEDLQEDLRLYSGILDEEHPDQRSWSERMQGDRVNPPRWQTRTFNDGRDILYESMTVDESDMRRYMFTDGDSIVNTFYNVVSQWAALFEVTDETSSKLGDDLESVTDSFQKHLNDKGFKYQLTQPIRAQPNGPNQWARRRELEKFSNWGTIQDMNGILGLILDFESNVRKRIDILNNVEDFKRDPFNRRLSSMSGADFEPRIITPVAYSSLFRRPSDMDKFKTEWITTITDTQIDLVLNSENGAVPRWGGRYEGSTSTNAPDLASALEELRNVEGSDGDGVGDDLVKKLHQVGMEHAKSEIEYDTESALHGPGYTNLPLWNQIENNKESTNGKNSLYNIVRHAYYLSDLDRLVDPPDSLSKKKSETMTFAAQTIYKSIEISIKQLNGKRVGLNEFEKMIVDAMNEGIKATINQFSRKALQIATIETEYMYYGGKIAEFNTIVGNTLTKFNTPALKLVISTSDVVKTVVRMQEASQDETPSLAIFEDDQVKKALAKNFEAKLQKKMTLEEKQERVNSWKTDLLILRALYKRVGFSKKQLKIATAVSPEAAQSMQRDSWQAKFGTDQVDRRNKAPTMASHSQFRSRTKREFTNTDQRQPYPANVVQSFKELARDIRLLTTGFQEPYFENLQARQEFLNSIKTGVDQTAEELYTKTVELNKRKYPGFQDGVETFASIDRFKRQFYRLLESIQRHDQDSRFSSKSFQRLEITDGVHYQKEDPLAASMAPNKRNASNDQELALQGITTFEIIIDGKPEWYALDLYFLYQKNQALYNELRSLTVTSKIALDREFQLDNQRTVKVRDVQLPEYISLVEKLNATKMQFEKRACMLIKRVIRQISTEMASPYSISNEVSEFIDSNPVDSGEPHGPLFLQIFQDLLGDLNTVVDFEEKWEEAIPRLQILRREDLYQRLKSNGNADSNPQTLFLDAQQFVDFSDYEDDAEQYKTFRDESGRECALYGIDLRVSTLHPDWNQLFKGYQGKVQSPDDAAERTAFGSMQNIGRGWERLAVPTAQEIVDVMAWFNRTQRDPRREEKRPPIRLVDTIDYNFYAYFVDIVCLSHAQPEKYMRSLAFAFEHRDISNTVIEEGQLPQGPIEIHGVALRSIYNPNNYASAVEEDGVDFYTTKRYFQKDLKDLEVPIQALAELIDNYELFRPLPARNDSYPTESIFEQNDAKMLEKDLDNLTRLPLNGKEFNLYMQNFLSRARTARFAAGIDDEVLKQSAYTVLNQNITQLHTSSTEAEKMESVYFIARFLKIPVYPRPADTQFANEQTYRRTISSGRRRWLQATKDDLEKANPRDYYDEEFVTRLELSKSIGEDEREDTDDAPIKDFVLINMIEFESDVNRIHDSSPPRIAPQVETNGRAPLSIEGQNQRYGEAYTTWYNKNLRPSNNRRLVDGAIDWVEAATTVENGDCFYHSIVSNLGTLFPQHQWTVQFGISENAVSNLKQLLMDSFQTAIDDLKRRRTHGNIPVAPSPYSNGYSRWKRCEYFSSLLDDSGNGTSLLKTNLFGDLGSYLADMEEYNGRMNAHNLPELNNSTSDLDILQKLCDFFRIDGVYANDMVIEMAIHTLQMPLLIYEDGSGVGWKHAVSTVNMRGEEYYHVGQPILLILRVRDHFKAIYPKHLETDSNRVIRTTWTDYVGNKRQRLSMATLPVNPVPIDITTKKRGRVR